MNREEYKQLLLDCYKKNNEFIENSIFVVTSGAITFLLGYSDKVNSYYWVYVISILSFFITLCLQLYSAYLSKEGCDLGFDEEQTEQSIEKFEASRKYEKRFYILFVVSIFLAGASVILNSSANAENKVESLKNPIQIEQIIEADKYSYTYKERR